jgi:hypothetical protein
MVSSGLLPRATRRNNPEDTILYNCITALTVTVTISNCIPANASIGIIFIQHFMEWGNCFRNSNGRCGQTQSHARTNHKHTDILSDSFRSDDGTEAFNIPIHSERLGILISLKHELLNVRRT